MFLFRREHHGLEMPYHRTVILTNKIVTRRESPDGDNNGVNTGWTCGVQGMTLDFVKQIIPTDHWTPVVVELRRGHHPPWSQTRFAVGRFDKTVLFNLNPPFTTGFLNVVRIVDGLKTWYFYTGTDADTDVAVDKFTGAIPSGKGNFTGGEFFNIGIRNLQSWWVIRGT